MHMLEKKLVLHLHIATVTTAPLPTTIHKLGLFFLFKANMKNKAQDVIDFQCFKIPGTC